MFAQVINVARDVYWITCRDHYTLGMIFWRAQEAFDGHWAEENPDVVPTLVNYMEWYASQSESGAFSYPVDWVGYNLTKKDLRKIYNDTELPDKNKYDEFMSGVIQMVEASQGDRNYCVIGTRVGDRSTLKHELAHSFWALDKDYKDAQKAFIEKLPTALYKEFSTCLQDMGYAKTSVNDELQAYCSADLAEPVLTEKTKGQRAKICKPFLTTLNNKLITAGLEHLIDKD